MIKHHPLHTDLVFLMLSETHLTMQKKFDALSHCESLWPEDWYIVVVRVYDTLVI